MMRLCSGECWSVFVEAGISPYIIFLTSGDLGISAQSQVTPQEMAHIRQQETHRAMAVLHASYTILSFPDLHLPFIPLEELIKAVLPLVREHGSDALFSFHPYELTPGFDHPDHTVAGTVARYVGAVVDVTHFLPESPALQQDRPELYLWVSHESTPTTIAMPLTPEARERRNAYLVQHHPSQFQQEDAPKWRPIFDKITASADDGKKHIERYVRVR